MSGSYKVFGEMLSAREMAERSGLPFTAIRSRLHQGMAPEEAMQRPLEKPRRFDFHGEKLTFKEVAERTGIGWNVLRNRVYGGMTMEEAVSHKRKPSTRKPVRRHRTPEEILRNEAIRLAAHGAGIKVNTLRQRLSKGLTLEEAATRPLFSKKSIDHRSIVGKSQGDLLATKVSFERGLGWIALCDCKCGKKNVPIKVDLFLGGKRKSCGCAQWRFGPREDRRKKYALADGRKLTAFQLAEISGINIGTIKSRIEKKGWTPEQAISIPPKKFENLVGQTFGRLKILRHVGSKVEWLCVCGKTGSSDRCNVTCGGSRSCGCGKGRKPGPTVDRTGQTTEGGIKILRLAPDKVKNHRGLWICLCPRCGKEFEATFEEIRGKHSCGCLSPRPRKQLNVFGAKLNASELAKISGTDRTTIIERMQQFGITAEQAAFGSFKPQRHKRRWIPIGGKMLTTSEVAEMAGICIPTFWTRYGRGFEPAKIIAMGPARPHKVYQSRRSRRNAKPK